MNYYELNIGDFMKKTRGRTLTERGAYLEMLGYYYAQEGPLPLDIKEVCRAIGAVTRAERAAVGLILETYFVKTETGFHNLRADEEIQEYHKYLKDQSEKGHKGAQKRWQRRSRSHSHGHSSGVSTANERQWPDDSPLLPTPSINNNKGARKEKSDDIEATSVSVPDPEQPSEWEQIRSIMLAVRAKSHPDWPDENLVSEFDWRHIKALYQGHGCDKLCSAIDELGQLSKYVTIDQIKKWLKGWRPNRRGELVPPDQVPQELTNLSSRQDRSTRTVDGVQSNTLTPLKEVRS